MLAIKMWAQTLLKVWIKHHHKLDTSTNCNLHKWAVQQTKFDNYSSFPQWDRHLPPAKSTSKSNTLHISRPTPAFARCVHVCYFRRHVSVRPCVCVPPQEFLRGCRIRRIRSLRRRRRSLRRGSLGAPWCSVWVWDEKIHEFRTRQVYIFIINNNTFDTRHLKSFTHHQSTITIHNHLTTSLPSFWSASPTNPSSQALLRQLQSWTW